MAINGFQNPGLKFPPGGGGLAGFQRQGMNQIKKNASGIQVVGIGAAGGSVSANTPVPFPLGAQVGDWAFITGTNASAPFTLSTAGWNFTTAGAMGYETAWKQITSAADLSTLFTSAMSSSTTVVVVLRGISAVNLKVHTEQQDDGSTTNTPTFTVTPGVKSPLAIGIMGLWAKSDGTSNGLPTTAPPSLVPGTATRATTYGPYNNGSYVLNFFIDLFPADYPDSAAWTTSGYMVPGSYNQRRMTFFEFT